MTRFDEVWSETVREIHARLADTEVIRYTRPDGVTVWVTCIILDIVMPLSYVRNLTVYGMTEDGERVEDEFWEGADAYPDEVARLVPSLTVYQETDLPHKTRS